MSEYMSFIKEELTAFESYLVATQRNNSTYIGTLRKFDKYLYTSYHEDYQLTKEMFDTWCRKHDNESNNTCRRRIQPILLFHRYLKERKLIDLQMRSTLCFILYYRLLWAYRSFRKWVKRV